MSASEHVMHRRLVLELCHGCADAETMRAAAEFASLLGLDLHGLFIEDAAVLALADMPFAREICLPTHEWQRIDADRMAAELRHAAVEARRMLREIATTMGVPNAFEILRGDPAEMIAAVLSSGDVFAIAPPDAAGARLTLGFARLHEAAHGSMASVLLLPGGFGSRHGPVVAVLAGAVDPSLPPAARLAVRAREGLVLLLPEDGVELEHEVVERAARLGVPRARITVRRLAGLQAADLLHALGHMRERLLVVTHDASPAGAVAEALSIAVDRGVPVLLVEPAGEGAQAADGTPASVHGSAAA